MAGFHGLWFGVAMPMIRAQDHLLKESGNPPPPGRRVASLRVRDIRDYLPGPWQPVPGMILLVGAVAVTWRMLEPATTDHGRAGAALFALLALGAVALYRCWLAGEVNAPQDLRSADPVATEQAWEELRRFRVRAVFVMYCVVPLLLLVFAVLGLEASRGAIAGNTLGLIGGIAGCALGLAGGIGGVIADLRRRRIEARRTLPGMTAKNASQATRSAG